MKIKAPCRQSYIHQGFLMKQNTAILYTYKEIVNKFIQIADPGGRNGIESGPVSVAVPEQHVEDSSSRPGVGPRYWPGTIWKGVNNKAKIEPVTAFSTPRRAF